MLDANGKFTAEPLITTYYPESLFTLEVILSETENDEKGINNKKMYSCNNRRLCLLKNLVKIGFIGKVKCKVVSKCGHDTIFYKNPFVNKGNKPGAYCRDLFPEIPWPDLHGTGM